MDPWDGAPWFDPAIPPPTASPVDRTPQGAPHDALALGFVAEWLTYPIDLEVRWPDDQFVDYSSEFSPASFAGAAAGFGTNLRADIPVPPSAQSVEQQQEDFLGLTQDMLPGAS